MKELDKLVHISIRGGLYDFLLNKAQSENASLSRYSEALLLEALKSEPPSVRVYRRISKTGYKGSSASLMVHASTKQRIVDLAGRLNVLTSDLVTGLLASALNLSDETLRDICDVGPLDPGAEKKGGRGGR